MSKKSIPLSKGIGIIATIAHGVLGNYMVVVDHRDTVINQGDLPQTLRALQEIRAIERQPLVYESEKEKLIWLPTRIREEILEKRWDERQALLNFWLARVTVSEEEAKKIPMSAEDWKKVLEIYHPKEG